MSHAKSLWFMFWVFQLVTNAVAISGVIHVDAWQKLVMALVSVFSTIAAFLAAQWQAPEKPAIDQPVKP